MLLKGIHLHAAQSQLRKCPVAGGSLGRLENMILWDKIITAGSTAAEDRHTWPRKAPLYLPQMLCPRWCHPGHGDPTAWSDPWGQREALAQLRLATRTLQSSPCPLSSNMIHVDVVSKVSMANMSLHISGVFINNDLDLPSQNPPRSARSHSNSTLSYVLGFFF